MKEIRFKINVVNCANENTFKVVISRCNNIIYTTYITNFDVFSIQCLNSKTDRIFIYPENENFYPKYICLTPTNKSYILNFLRTDSKKIRVIITDKNYSKKIIKKGILKLWQTSTISQ